MEKHDLVTAHRKKPTLDPADPNSFRPISELSFVSKLVERAVAVRFVKHCEQNSLLLARQSGYRHYHSAETAVLIVYNDTIPFVRSTEDNSFLSSCST